MKARHKRIVFSLIALVAVVFAALLINQALQSNLAYFFSPTQVNAGEAPKDNIFRVGGMVKEGSLKRHDESLTVEFLVFDTQSEIKVFHTGILPDLFKEGQGVVAKGRLNSDGVFVAQEVLAKHDESYMPPEVADLMKTTNNIDKK